MTSEHRMPRGSEQPRLEPREGGGAAIIRAGKEWPLPPEVAQHILAWYGHMRGHSEDRAQIYLAGVIDGLWAGETERARELARKTERLLQDIKASLGEASDNQPL
jgi:hypothetical protein